MKFFARFWIAISLSFFTTNTALAQLTYRPSSSRQQQQQTQSATTRGCGSSVAQLQLLAPGDRVAVTVSKHPTFLLSVSDVPDYPLEISLTRPHAAETLWQTSKIIKRKGIFSIKLPESVKLQNNTDYILTVKLLCDLLDLDSSVFVRAVFEKVGWNRQTFNPDSSLDQKQAESLANQGIWYDTLAWSYENSPANFQSLLNQAGISLNFREN